MKFIKWSSQNIPYAVKPSDYVAFSTYDYTWHIGLRLSVANLSSSNSQEQVRDTGADPENFFKGGGPMHKYEK